MIKEITGYPLFAIFLSLLFLLVFLQVERHKKRITAFFTVPSRISKTFSRNKIILIGLVWAGILLLRKLIYYVPTQKVIQTKSSIWWVDLVVLIIIYCVPVGILFGPSLARLIKRIDTSKVSKFVAQILWIVVLLMVSRIFAFFNNEDISLEKLFLLIIFAPFLLLKMICTGKYIGIFTSLVLAFFIVEHHKKIIKGIRKPGKKFIITSISIFILLGIYIFHQFPVNWENRFQQKVQAATSKRAIEDLLDAMNTINHEAQRFNAIRAITMRIAGVGDREWQRATFPEVITAAEAIGERKRVFKLLEEIAFAIRGTGDSQWAKSVAERLPELSMRTRELKKEILGKIERTNDR